MGRRKWLYFFVRDGERLVKEGWCWWYRKYAPQDAELERLEREARDAKKGLWQDLAPIPPWVYRKTRRGQSLDLSNLVPLEGDTEGTTASSGPPRLGGLTPLFLYCLLVASCTYSEPSHPEGD